MYVHILGVCKTYITMHIWVYVHRYVNMKVGFTSFNPVLQVSTRFYKFQPGFTSLNPVLQVSTRFYKSQQDFTSWPDVLNWGRPGRRSLESGGWTWCRRWSNGPRGTYLQDTGTKVIVKLNLRSALLITLQTKIQSMNNICFTILHRYVSRYRGIYVH
jgi:hypothetical protein